MSDNTVYAVTWSGSPDDATAVIRGRFPDSEIVFLSKRELREAGWRGQWRKLRSLRGKALIFFAERMDDFAEPQLLWCTGFVHRCDETILADSSGQLIVTGRRHLWLLAGRIIPSALFDAIVLLAAWLTLHVLTWFPQPLRELSGRPASEVQLAYLYPFPLDRSRAGGALSHVCGFLGGLAKCGTHFVVWTGRMLPASAPTQLLTSSLRRLYLLRESVVLSYTLRFLLAAGPHSRRTRPAFFYQRHGAYIVSGALLSRIYRIPLVLEYNGSEEWVAKHWDPCRFPALLRLCEQFSISAASCLVVVSDALREELIGRGVPAERILVNPNGVDPEIFHPDCGGLQIRERFSIAPDEIVVGFVGTFSYWHGVGVLQQCIDALLQDAGHATRRVRFLLVGDGPLRPEMRAALSQHERQGDVIFTGLIPHNEVPAHMDACDILVSPHVPMPDYSSFFGSPTKLFEYMAVGKAIVASALEQIAQVLENGHSALLVQPGNVTETANAIRLLADDPELRIPMGRNAADVARRGFSWQANAERLLARLNLPRDRRLSDEPVSRTPRISTVIR